MLRFDPNGRIGDLHLLALENEHLRLEVLPEIGAKLGSALREMRKARRASRQLPLFD